MTDVNEYFDGKVKSLSFKTKTQPATVGVMLPGEYVFNTNEKEKVTLVSGAMSIRLTPESAEVTYHEGESFSVDANSAFDVRVESDVAYLCVYG